MSNIGKVGIWLILSLLSAAAQAGTKYYYYTDPQGTVLAEADAQGNIIATYDYAPYGKQVLGTPPNGPAGYTGHVNDAESGLIYMQQRYYDPTIQRFLSVDPIVPSPGSGFDFNRYVYANNNPAVNIDSDGRKVAFGFRNGATEQDRTATMTYLAASPTAAHEINQLKNSGTKYTIVFDRKASGMGFDDTRRLVTINPASGLRIKSSGAIQSPALGAGHEFSHAAEYDRVGSKAFVKNLESPYLGMSVKPDGTMVFNYGVSPEERRATQTENKMAKELGEEPRRNYDDSYDRPVTTCGPTSTKEC